MPHGKLKDIYLAKNLQDLNKQTDITSTANPRGLAKSFKKLVEYANESYLERDEEKAYVLFMKLLNIHSAIKKSAEYKKDAKYFNSLCSSNEIMAAMNKAEELSVNLKNRYDENEAKEIAEKLGSAEIETKLDPNNTLNSSNSVTKEIIVPLIKPVSDFISPTELYSLIIESKSFLIMDIRLEFDDSQVNVSNCISVPESLIVPGCTSNKVESQLNSTALLLWKSRHNYDSIILIDWDTNSNNLHPSLPICHLRSALFTFSSNPVKIQPLILEGGYEQWLLYYPTCTTNSSVKKPTKHVDSQLPTLEAIAYHSDIFDRPSEILNPEVPQIDIKNIIKEQMLPSVNRSNKPKMEEKIIKIEPKPLPIVENAIINIPSVDRTVKPKLGSIVVPPNPLPSAPHQEIELKTIQAQKELADIEDLKNRELKSLADMLRQKKKYEQEINEMKASQIISNGFINEDRNTDLKTYQEEITKIIKAEGIVPNSFANKIQNNDLNEKIRSESPIPQVQSRTQNQLTLNEIANTNLNDAQKQLKLNSNTTANHLQENETANLTNQKKIVIKNENEASSKLVDMIPPVKVINENKVPKANVQVPIIQVPNERPKTVPNVVRQNTKDKVINENNVPKGNMQVPIIQVPNEKPRIIPNMVRHITEDKENYSRNSNYNERKMKQGNYKTQLKEESEFSGGLKRSHSSPNVAKLVDESKIRQPTADRALKPNLMPANIQMSTELSMAKVRQLNPVWGSSHQGLTGLRNLGNTCYLNSIIQCLGNAVPLCVYFVSNNYVQDLNKEIKPSHYITNEFATVVKALWSAQYKVISPIDFRTSICQMDSMFATSEHQDAQELLQYLLTGLHDALNKGIKKSPRHEQNNENLDDEIAAENSWKFSKYIDDSIIVDMFTGQYKSAVKCLTCHKNSILFENFTCLTLQIPSPTKCHLSDCLMQFSKEERMTGDSQWHCPRCACKRDASKRIVIWRLPKILIIHLKRFHYEGMWRNKITTNVSFPVESLNLNRYASSNKYPQQPYNLFAVANHYGTLDGGHYNAFCKNPKLNRWFKFDDSDVSELDTNSIQTSAAYLLFYSSIKMEMRWV